jgi:hypothetical protein
VEGVKGIRFFNVFYTLNMRVKRDNINRAFEILLYKDKLMLRKTLIIVFMAVAFFGCASNSTKGRGDQQGDKSINTVLAILNERQFADYKKIYNDAAFEMENSDSLKDLLNEINGLQFESKRYISIRMKSNNSINTDFSKIKYYLNDNDDIVESVYPLKTKISERREFGRIRNTYMITLLIKIADGYNLNKNDVFKMTLDNGHSFKYTL